MARGRGDRRRGGVALILLASLLVIGIALPIIVSVSSNRITVAPSTLVAAPRDSFVVTQTVALGSSGLVSIGQGTLFPADAAGRALTVPLSPAQIASGTARFALQNAHFRIQAGQQAIAADPQSPIIDALSNLQFDTLLLRNATVQVLLPDGRTETISDVDGEVTPRRKTALQIQGKGALRGQKISFESTVGLPTDLRLGSTVPIKLSLKSTLLEANLDGRLGLVGPPQVQGAIEFSTPHVRQFARWFGAAWPGGNGLRNLTGRGQLDWAGPAMAFNRANFAMDGNEAIGTLNLRFTDTNPSIGGTLALKVLDLSKYFPFAAITPTSGLKTVWNAVLGNDLSLPIIQKLDADIRISADKVILGTHQIGRSAATVTVAKGMLLADIGAMEFDGGRGTGQISADMSGTIPRFSTRGRLEDLDAAKLTTSWFGHGLLTGRALLTVDLTSIAKMGDELLPVTNGRVSVPLRNGGKIGVDLSGLIAATQKRALEGWATYGRTQTSFDDMDAALSFRSGALVVDDIKVTSGSGLTSLVGNVDLMNSKINLQVKTSSMKTAATAAADTPPTILQIFGLWSAPTIRNETTPDRAAVPTMFPHVEPSTLPRPAKL